MLNFLRDNIPFLSAYPIIEDLIFLFIIIFLGILSYWLGRKYLRPLFSYTLKQSKLKWSKILMEEKVFDVLLYLLPTIILYQGLRLMPNILPSGQKVINILVFLIIFSALIRLLNVSLKVYNTYPVAQKRPIKGYMQIAKLILYLLGAIIITSILIDQSPWIFLSGLGAMTAVLLLIFQNTILSFIASLQIMGNDLIRVGDWLQADQFNADGTVIEIALYNIRVRNWDNTITIIPTSKLVEDSFINWRGMSEAGGRRIMRSLLIDQNSIKFLNREDILRLEKITLIRDYLQYKKEEIAAYNHRLGPEGSHLCNGRNLTNIGTFRAYVSNYLKEHPLIHKQMIVMVRQLAPTTEGLPLQIYAFCRDVNWINYESIQGDIFDHLLAVINEFDLQVYQKPAGIDLATALKSNLH